MSSESGGRWPLRPGARLASRRVERVPTASASDARSAAFRLVPLALCVLLVLPGTLACGLKGDPLPPIRPPEPAAEEVPAETEGTADVSEGSEPAAGDGEGEDDGEGEEDSEAEEDGEGQAEGDGEGAQGPA